MKLFLESAYHISFDYRNEYYTFHDKIVSDYNVHVNNVHLILFKCKLQEIS